MAMTKLICALLALALPFHAAADLLGADFLRWFWIESVIDGTYLYIAGGELWSADTTSTTPNNPGLVNYDHGVHVIDLSQAWDTSSVGQTDTPTQDTNLKVRKPTFWNDPVAKSVNVYGGWPYVTDPNFISYTSSWPDNSGSNLKAHARFGNDGTMGFAFTRKMGGLTTTSDKAYYNLGGFGTSSTDPLLSGLPATTMLPESGLLEFDYANQTWTNHTTSFNRIFGEAQFVPMFGQDGVIAFIGGDKPTNQNYPSYSSSLVDMTTITIYDIASQQYYDQPTTGATPTPRSLFCSVGVYGGSNNTFEIFVFGGLPGTLSTATKADMGIVYILSLPSFVWTKTSTSATWRYSNNCQVIGKSQMLNIGGVASNFTEKDDLPGGLAIFNLNTLSWQTSYNPKAAAYTAPSAITALYDSSGNPKTAPTFASTALASIFKKATTTSSSSSGGSSSSSTSTSGTSTSSSSSSATSHKTPVGAIVGGAVGGVAFVIILAVLGFLFFRKMRGNSNPRNPDASEMAGSESNFYYGSNPPASASEMGADTNSRRAELQGLNRSSGSPSQPQYMSGTVGADGQMYQFKGYGGGNFDEGMQIPRKELKPVGMEQTPIHELG